MSLSDVINNGYEAEKVNNNVLTVRYSFAGYATVMAFDFAARIMVTRTDGHGDGGAVVTPFSQLDRSTLIDFRDKLVELGSKPPELPPAAPETPPKRNRLNL